MLGFELNHVSERFHRRFYSPRFTDITTPGCCIRPCYPSQLGGSESPTVGERIESYTVTCSGLTYVISQINAERSVENKWHFTCIMIAVVSGAMKPPVVRICETSRKIPIEMTFSNFMITQWQMLAYIIPMIRWLTWVQAPITTWHRSKCCRQLRHNSEEKGTRALQPDFQAIFCPYQ